MSGGIGSILSMARTAMNAQQTVLQIASQNMSNAATEGYSRQRVELTEAGATVFSYGSVGTGVKIQGITRARDSVLDTAFRQGSSGAAAADTTNTALSQIQSILGEPSDTGLNAALDKFWGAWNDLSADPTNTAAKSVVKEAGNNVASTLNRYASQLDQLSANNRDRMKVDVQRVNELTTHISKLNDQIVASETGGQTANDLRDARDKDLDELSQLIGAQTVEHQNGSVAVYASGRMLVDGTVMRSLTVDAGNPPTVSFGNGSAPISDLGGSLGAEVTVSTRTIPDVMSRLDALASSLVQNVNAIHSAGTVYSGSPATASPAGNFFDVTTPAPTGTDTRLTARGIRLSPTLTTSTVATAGASSTGPGNNDTALALANLRDSMVGFANADGSTETTKFGDFYSEAVGHVATLTQHAEDDATVQHTLASNADTRRQSVSSVNTDEELIKVIQAQHAYQGAARLVTVVDEMMDTLVNLGR
jgi:flagellar hook-associated protein 1 FlgK